MTYLNTNQKFHSNNTFTTIYICYEKNNQVEAIITTVEVETVETVAEVMVEIMVARIIPAVDQIGGLITKQVRLHIQNASRFFMITIDILETLQQI